MVSLRPPNARERACACASANGGACCALLHLTFSCEHVCMGSGCCTCISVSHMGACNVSHMPRNMVTGGGACNRENPSRLFPQPRMFLGAPSAFCLRQGVGLCIVMLQGKMAHTFPGVLGNCDCAAGCCWGCCVPSTRCVLARDALVWHALKDPQASGELSHLAVCSCMLSSRCTFNRVLVLWHKALLQRALQRLCCQRCATQLHWWRTNCVKWTIKGT